MRLLRRLVIPLFAKINPGDITIRHHYTGDSFHLHSFRHKNYWIHGRRRETETMELFARLIEPGNTVLDVGANIGYVSLFLSRLVGDSGRIYSFEPGEDNLRYLERNTRDKRNITVISKGAGNIDGRLTFFEEDLSGQNNSFVSDFQILLDNAERAGIRPNVRQSSVDVTTIDSFIDQCKARADFIKVDVEGYEHEVILGMERALRSFRPVLMVEVARNQEAVFNLLTGHGYLLYNVALNRIDDYSELSDNIFCIHKSDSRTLNRLRY